MLYIKSKLIKTRCRKVFENVCLIWLPYIYIYMKGVMVVQANGWFVRFKIIVFEKLIVAKDVLLTKISCCQRSFPGGKADSS